MFLRNARNNPQIDRCENPEDGYRFAHSRRINLATNKKVKVKFTLEQATKARGGGGRCIALLFLLYRR
jgi:hypothetical protein